MSAWLKFSTEEIHMLHVSTIGFIVAAVITAIVFARRLRKIYLDQEREWFLAQIVPKITSLTIRKSSPLEWRKNIKNLVSIIGKSPFKKQVTIDYLMHLKNNLNEESSAVLLRLYHDLSLPAHSSKKLSSKNWRTQVEGIRELASMRHYFVVRMKSLLMKTKNKILRDELLLAMMQLEKDPLSVMYLVHFELTDWLKLNIHLLLSRCNPKDISNFSDWFTHSNEDLALFFIKMAGDFKQVASTPGLVKLLAKGGTRAHHAMKALIELNDFTHTQAVAKLANSSWSNPAVCLDVLHYLSLAERDSFTNRAIDQLCFHPFGAVKQKAISLVYPATHSLSKMALPKKSTETSLHPNSYNYAI